MVAHVERDSPLFDQTETSKISEFPQEFVTGRTPACRNCLTDSCCLLKITHQRIEGCSALVLAHGCEQPLHLILAEILDIAGMDRMQF